MELQRIQEQVRSLQLELSVRNKPGKKSTKRTTVSLDPKDVKRFKQENLSGLVWKSGAGRSGSRANEADFQENYVKIMDTPTTSYYCGYGRPPVDKPPKTLNTAEEDRKHSLYSTFFLRTETSEFNCVNMTKMAQAKLLIESLQLSYALATRKINIREFQPSNNTPENRAKWALASSMPVTEETINGQLTQKVDYMQASTEGVWQE